MLSLVEVRDDALRQPVKVPVNVNVNVNALRQPAKAGAMTASLGAGESDMGTAAGPRVRAG